MTMLSAIIDEPPQKTDATVIWLHGLGASNDDFASLLPELRAEDALTTVRFVFPQAPMLFVTVNNGIRMPAWYDIFGFEDDTRQDVAGLVKMQEIIANIIFKQIESGISSRRIVVMGFSQGAAMALQVGLRFQQPLGGIISLSGYLPIQETLSAECHAANQKTPIKFFHGSKDNVVPMAWALAAKTLLEKMDYPVEWAEYPIAHTLCFEELIDIKQALGDCLKMPIPR